ncbi:hypothetical protein [Gemmiger formicilis]|jgi:hypothetical protein|uniref:hypothetical protein n=1 Tax=Gemmiger formicilis TaxID=745368 RepID=UPI0022E05264|nr:hypothetical protein [Gemmiger formicilis]
MVKYVKKNGIEKPVWIDPLFPAFRGLLDAVLQKVKVQSKSNLCVGGFIERTTREATLYEQAATTCLLKTLDPLSLELEAARKKSAMPLPEHSAQAVSTTEGARSARRAAAQQAQAAADKTAAEEKAAEIENKMLQQIAITENDIAEAYAKINIMVARFCKGTAFKVIADEIPVLTPHVFDAQAIVHRYGLHYNGSEAA